jgi:hypothetical protein
LLVEVKTVVHDEAAQVRLAAGQLCFYEYFNVRPHWPGRTTTPVAVFDKPIRDELVDYLSSKGIAALVSNDDGTLTALNESGSAVLAIFGDET